MRQRFSDYERKHYPNQHSSLRNNFAGAAISFALAIVLAVALIWYFG